MIKGKTTARASKRTVARRGTATSGDDNSTIGNSVIAGVTQIDSMATVSTTAISTANKNGAANAMTSVRRSRSAGHSVSRIAAQLGCAASTHKTMAATPYASPLLVKISAENSAN